MTSLSQYGSDIADIFLSNWMNWFNIIRTTQPNFHHLTSHSTPCCPTT